jgi:hypothetical protein
VNAHDIPNLLFAILLIGGAVFGALNLQLYIMTYKQVKELKRQNRELRLKLLECQDEPKDDKRLS